MIISNYDILDKIAEAPRAAVYQARHKTDSERAAGGLESARLKEAALMKALEEKEALLNAIPSSIPSSIPS